MLTWCIDHILLLLFFIIVKDTETLFTVRLYLTQVEYSQRYAETNTQAQSLRHLLSEAHILLRASLLQRGAEQQSAEGETAPQEQGNHGELDEALRQNCAQLGDSFSRYDP